MNLTSVVSTGYFDHLPKFTCPIVIHGQVLTAVPHSSQGEASKLIEKCAAESIDLVQIQGDKPEYVDFRAPAPYERLALLRVDLGKTERGRPVARITLSKKGW